MSESVKIIWPRSHDFSTPEEAIAATKPRFDLLASLGADAQITRIEAEYDVLKFIADRACLVVQSELDRGESRLKLGSGPSIPSDSVLVVSEKIPSTLELQSGTIIDWDSITPLKKCLGRIVRRIEMDADGTLWLGLSDKIILEVCPVRRVDNGQPVLFWELSD